MNTVLVLGCLGIVGLVIATLLGRKDDKKQAELQAKKDEDQAQLNKLKEQQTHLKDNATASESNASEEHKDEFWKDELK